MKHSGLDQVSRNNSKTGNVFSASFKKGLAVRRSLPKSLKVWFSDFFCLTWTLSFRRMGSTAALLGIENDKF